jgi:ABC-2 type transport system ATP-binding protein
MGRDDDPPILQATDVGKSYGTRRALRDVSFAVRPGEIIGLLGPNGAGKTTTLSILSTVLAPDSGVVRIAGRSPRDEPALRRRLGLVPQSLALYTTLSALQNVRHFASMQGLTRRDATDAAIRTLDLVGLADRAHDTVRTLSGGMQRRLNLACGIVHRPAVLLLDEPTVGVDLESRERILALVRGLRDDGTGVVYSTHYMEEAERICDRVLLIDDGTLVADGTVETLIARAGARPRMELMGRAGGRAWGGGGGGGVREVGDSRGEGRLTLELASLAQVAPLLEQLNAAGIAVLNFNLHSPNLADAFLALTGRSLGESAAA